MPDKAILAAIMAESAKAMDAMIASNMNQDRAFFGGSFTEWLHVEAKTARDAMVGGGDDGSEQSEDPKPA